MSFVDPTPRLRSAQQHSDDSGVPGIIVFDAIEELIGDHSVTPRPQGRCHPHVARRVDGVELQRSHNGREVLICLGKPSKLGGTLIRSRVAGVHNNVSNVSVKPLPEEDEQCKREACPPNTPPG